METAWWTKLLAFYVIVHLVVVSQGQSSVDYHDENQELSTLLRESKQQNRRLKKQMDRLKLTCSVPREVNVTASLCTCETNVGVSSPMVPPSTATTVTPVKSSETIPTASPVTSPPQQEIPLRVLTASTASPVTSPPQQEIPLRVLTASSSDSKTTGNVTLTVTYTAPTHHSLDWRLVYKAYNMQSVIRSGGREGPCMGKFSSSIVVPYIESLKSVHLDVHAGTETVVVEFMISEITARTYKFIPELTSPMRPAQLTVVAPSTGYVNATIVVEGDPEHTYATADMPEIFMMGLRFDQENVNVFKIKWWETIDFYQLYEWPDEFHDLVLTVPPPYAQQGGMLTVRLTLHPVDWVFPNFGLVAFVRYGRTLTILPPDRDDVFPMNTVGTVGWPNTTLMVLPQRSLSCLAMGNPQPRLQMFRELDDGSRVVIPTETLYEDNRKVIVSHTLVASNKTTGNYTCRAASGSAVSEERTEVFLYTPAVFDERATRLVKNHKRKTVFSCRARGELRPQLQFRKNEETGPNLATVDGIKVKIFHPGKFSSRIAMTISPPKPDIDIVYCVAIIRGAEHYSKIRRPRIPQ